MAKGKEPTGGLSLVREALDNPTPAPEVGRAPSAREADDEPNLPFLPPNCPVEPLGIYGQQHHYLDEHRQHIVLTPDKHGKGHIIALFGRKSQMCLEFWPRYSDKKGEDGKPIITGWRPEEATLALMHACSTRGIFDPQGKVRGTGAHRGDDGELILHCGDKIFVTAEPAGYQDPGFLGGYVYPAGPSRPRPDPTEQTTAPGELILQMLHAWNWFRPTADPMLALGWVGCALVGGALTWRPNAWITGGTGTGKSTLQAMLRALFDGGALTTGDATEASIRQLLKQQTLPVFFDELEPDDKGDNRKTNAVIKLARLASSGEQALRGSSTHEGHEFTIRSCFLFSSILIPPTLAQDRNRLAILELDRIPPGKVEPTIDLAELRLIGRQLRKRIVDHWHRLDQLLGRYKTALAEYGHNGRSGDQFGTLLAMADLLLWDAADEKNVMFWAEQLRADTLAEKATELPDEEEIVQFLASSFLPQRGGDEPAPIARHIRDAVAPGGLDGNNKASDRLENFGLRVVQKSVTTKDGKTTIGAGKPNGTVATADLYLAVANAHTALERIFQDNRWALGTWSQSLGRVEGAHRRVKVRFASAKGQWATLIPLKALLDFDPIES